MSDNIEKGKGVWTAERLADAMRIVRDLNRFLLAACQQSIYADSGRPEEFPFHLAEEFAIREGKVSFESLPAYVIIAGTEQPTYEHDYDSPALQVPKRLMPMKMSAEEIKALDKLAFNYLGKYTRTSVFFFELMIYTAGYYHGVVDIDESLVRYSRLLQYIDPEDEATQKSVHKTYSLWQAVWFFLLPRLSSFQMKFPRPENKLPYLETGCDCAFNPALLELYEPDTVEHLAENYPCCKDSKCRTCERAILLIDICLALMGTSNTHVKVCSFFRWQCRLQEKHTPLCRDRDTCSFCIGISGKFGRERLTCYDWRMETPRTEEETLIREQKDEEAAEMVGQIMTDPDTQTKILSREYLLHVTDCLRYGCNKPMCDELKILIHHHPNTCTSNKNCKMCDGFKFIFDYHDSICDIDGCFICCYPKFQRFYQLNRLAQLSSANSVRPLPVVEIEYSPPPGPPPPVKDCTFMYFYKDAKMAFGCGSPPEALVFFDYVSRDDECPLCGTRHYCNLCQVRLQRKLQSMQRQLSDWLVHSAEMKLGEMMRWTSLEIILKRADKRVRDAYGRMREMLLPGHKLDPKFMELLFKKDFEKSIGMLTAKLDKKEYYPDSYDQKAKNHGTKTKTSAKSEATKKKELKMAKKKDGKIQLSWNTGCTMCTRSNMCETCTDHMKKTTLEAQDSLKNILREYSVLSQEDVDLKKRISFVDVFRKLDQDRRELIGKRILQMLEKVHDENIPVKYMDVWYNTDVNKKFEKNTLRWKQVMAETNSRITTTQALLSTGSRPAQPAAQAAKSKATSQPKKSVPKKTAPASQEAAPQPPAPVPPPVEVPAPAELEPTEQQHTSAITAGPCPQCPPEKYCKTCKTEKLCELQHGMLIAREFHKIQIKCGRKATKEEISAVLEDTEIERIYMMMRWKDPEDGTRREQLGEYMVGMIATNWARWMGICHDQVETLQADKRLQWADYEKIHMPLGDFDDDQSTVAAGGQDEPMPSSSARQSLPERRQENDAENYEFGQWDEYEANDFGYAFTYEGNVPVVVIPKKKFMHEKTKREARQATEALDSVKLPLTRDQELAEHIHTCDYIGECDQCREFLLPLIRHYKFCHQPNCQRCEAGRQQSANIYRWSREGDDLAEAILLVEQDLIKQRDAKKASLAVEEEQYDEPYEENGSNDEVLEDMYLEGNCEKGTPDEEPPEDEAPLTLGYAHYIPEDYNSDPRQYEKLRVDILGDAVNEYIINHCDNCQMNDSVACHLCFLTCAAYRYYDHMYKDTSAKCRREELGYCNICDFYLHAAEAHLIVCADSGCMYCLEVKKLIGKKGYDSQKRAATARAQCIAKGIIVRPQPTVRSFGTQSAFTFIRRRDELVAAKLHVDNCSGNEENCALCRVEYAVDRIMEHLSQCNGANVDCETCREHGPEVATHLMACNYIQCAFCITVKKVNGMEWYGARQQEYRTYHGYGEEFHHPIDVPVHKGEAAPEEGDCSQMDQSIRASHTSSEGTWTNPLSGKSPVNPLSSSSSSRSASSSQLYESMSSQVRPSQRPKKKTTKERKSSGEPSGSDDDVLVDPNVVPNPLPFKPIPPNKKYKFTKFTEAQMEQMCPHLTQCSDSQCPECEKYMMYLRHRNDCKNPVSKCALCSHFEEAKIIHIQRCPDAEQCKYCRYARRAMGQEAFDSIMLYMTDAAELFATQHAKAIKLTAINGRRNQRKVKQN